MPDATLTHLLLREQFARLAAEEKLVGFRNELSAIIHSAKEPIVALKKIKERLTALPCENEHWVHFEEQVIEADPFFKTALLHGFPTLTKMELRVCTLLRLNVRTEDIARHLSVTERTIEFHRLNIRKKLGLKKEESLRKFLSTI